MTARIGAVASRLTHIVVAVVFAAAVVGCRNGGTQEDGHSTNNRLARQSDGLAASETFRQLSPRGAPVTFNRDVAPILFRRCSNCHRPGEAGPFDLLTYNDAKTRRDQIVYVTQQHIMPPWLPEDACEEFVGQRHLTKEELDTIAKWVQQGAFRCSVSITPQDVICLALWLAPREHPEANWDPGEWGQPAFWLRKFPKIKRIGWLESEDGGRTFRTRSLVEHDPKIGALQPTMEKPTGFNQVPWRPGFVYFVGHDRYTEGGETLDNLVYYVDQQKAGR